MEGGGEGEKVERGRWREVASMERGPRNLGYNHNLAAACMKGELHTPFCIIIE